MKTLNITIALIASLPAAALAEQPRAQARVAYQDLNLRTESGVRTLDRRLARAVEAVCPDGRGSVDMARKVAARRCIRDTTAELAAVRSHVLAGRGADETLAAGTR